MDKPRPGAPAPEDASSSASDELEPPAPEPAEQLVAAGPFLVGQILIAMPGIGDPRFDRTVLMLCAHDENQAMAIVLNRPLQGLSVPALLARLGMAADTVPEAPVMYGGPVERERGYVLHTDDFSSAESTLEVGNGVALTDTREVLEALGDELRRPRRSLLALGYAGWGSGQLEQELQQGVWLTCEADEDLLFDRDHGSKWDRALAKIGVTADRLSVQAGRA